MWMTTLLCAALLLFQANQNQSINVGFDGFKFDMTIEEAVTIVEDYEIITPQTSRLDSLAFAKFGFSKSITYSTTIYDLPVGVIVSFDKKTELLRDIFILIDVETDCDEKFTFIHNALISKYGKESGSKKGKPYWIFNGDLVIEMSKFCVNVEGVMDGVGVTYKKTKGL